MKPKKNKMNLKSKSDIVVGVFKIKNHPFRSFWCDSGYLKPFKKDFLKFYQRQIFPPCYYPTGSIYTFWNKTLKNYGNMYGTKIKPLIISEDELNIDIDNIYDFFISEMTSTSWKDFKKKFVKNVSKIKK